MDGYNPYRPPTQDPTPGPILEGGPSGAPVPWTISEVLSVGFDVVLKQRPLELIGGFFLVGLLSQLPGLLPLVLMLSGIIEEGSVAAVVLQGIVMVASLVLGLFFWVGQIRVGLAAVRQEPFDFNLFFSGTDRLVPMLAVTFLAYLGVVLGVLLLVVPGFIVAMGWALSGPLVVDAGYSPVEALRESWEAMRGHKLQMFLFGIVATLMLFAGLCACYVGFLIVMPAVTIAFLEAYRRITGRMNGASVVPMQSAPAAGLNEGWMTPPRAF